MEYAQINGKKVTENSFEEIVSFFTQEIMFGVLEGGRGTIRQNVENAMENVASFMRGINPKLRDLDSVSRKEYALFVSHFMVDVADGLITQGSKGVHLAVFKHCSSLNVLISAQCRAA